MGGCHGFGLSVGSSLQASDTCMWLRRMERSSQFVQRRVRLPESANLAKITAKMENGVLRLDIPKVEEKVRQHTITVQ
jgi:HSP20 family molecular chaperone IbpA